MAGEVALRKRLRMTLDFEVVAEELTDEYLRDYYRGRTNYEEMVGEAEIWANVAKQITLQRALLGDERALRRYLTYVVTSEVNLDLDSDLGEVFGVDHNKAEEGILGPLFSRLSPEDAEYWRGITEANALLEGTEVLSHSFRVRWLGARLEEIGWAVEGALEVLVDEEQW